MAPDGRLSLDLDLGFPLAGVGFRLTIRPPDDAAQGYRLRIALHSLMEGKEARFSKDASYALGDFVGGFCRWLGTKQVHATYTEQEISGHFDPSPTALQVLRTTQEICEMLDNKFGLYPHAILT